MRIFVRAIATGFALSMGSAIFKKVADKMGLDNEEPKPEETPVDPADLAGEDSDQT